MTVRQHYIMNPAKDYILVTKADADLPDGNARALLVTVAGTLNLTTVGGVERDGVPVTVGWNPIQCSQVRLGGSADGIWAIY